MRCGIVRAQRQFGLGLQAGEGRAQLVCRVGHETLLRRHHLFQPFQQVVHGVDQRPHFGRGFAAVKLAQVVAPPVHHLMAQFFQRTQALLQAVPDNGKRDQRQQQLRDHDVGQNAAYERLALLRGFGNMQLQDVAVGS